MVLTLSRSNRLFIIGAPRPMTHWIVIPGVGPMTAQSSSPGRKVDGQTPSSAPRPNVTFVGCPDARKAMIPLLAFLAKAVDPRRTKSAAADWRTVRGHPFVTHAGGRGGTARQPLRITPQTNPAGACVPSPSRARRAVRDRLPGDRRLDYRRGLLVRGGGHRADNFTEFVKLTHKRLLQIASGFAVERLFEALRPGPQTLPTAE
jgi:hypothetical protein